MWITVGFSKTMIGGDSTTQISSTPASSLMQRTLHALGLSTTTMPLVPSLSVSNSLQNQSHRRTPDLLRLDSTGQTIEDSQQEKLVRSTSTQSSRSLDTRFSFLTGYPVHSLLTSYGADQLETMQKSVRPHSGPPTAPILNTSAAVPFLKIHASTSEVNFTSQQSVGLRMASSCGSLPNMSMGGGLMGLYGGNETAHVNIEKQSEEPMDKISRKSSISEDIETTMNMQNSQISQTSSSEIDNFEVVSKDLHRAISQELEKQKRQEYQLKMSSDEPPAVPQSSPVKGSGSCYNDMTLQERLQSPSKGSPPKRNGTCNGIKPGVSSPVARKLQMSQSSDSDMEKRLPNLSAMGKINLEVRYSSPETSPRKKSRPSLQKRQRHHHQSIHADVHVQTERNSSPSSDSNQSPQSFTITVSEVSSDNVSSSPPKQRTSPQKKSDDPVQTDASENPQNSTNSRPTVLKLNFKIRAGETDEVMKGKSPDLSPIAQVEEEEESDVEVQFETSSPPKQQNRCRFFRSLSSSSEEESSEESSDDEDDEEVNPRAPTPRPKKKQNPSRYSFDSDSDSDDDVDFDRSKPSKVPSTCFKVLARVHRDSESKLSESWDEEDGAANDAEWEAMCGQGALFACSLTTVSLPSVEFETPDEEPEEEPQEEATEEPKESCTMLLTIITAQEAQAKWDKVYGDVQPEESRPTTVCFPEADADLSEMHLMAEWANMYEPSSAQILDAERFRRAIANVDAAIKHVLTPEHRERVYAERFADGMEASAAGVSEQKPENSPRKSSKNSPRKSPRKSHKNSPRKSHKKSSN